MELSDSQTYYQKTRRVVLVGAFFNVFLGITKVVAGILGHSYALVIDGIHSFSDLLTDFLVWFASYYGSQDADEDHPYGHGRFETAATVALALLLIIVGLGIVLEIAVSRFGHDDANVIVTPKYYVFVVIVASLAIKEWLYRYTRRVGKIIESELLQANAWHHRSDAASSLVVLAGVIGTMFGFAYFDAVAALVVGLMIAKMGIDLGWPSLLELVDTGVSVEKLAAIKQTISKMTGIVQLHQLRTRSMRGKVLVDVHIQVENQISVSEGHHISQQVHQALLNEFTDIADVTVHVDPEDDEVAAPSQHLPTRAQLESLLREAWRDLPGGQHIANIGFHYFDGKISLEVTLPTSVEAELEQDALKSLSSDYLAVVKTEFDFIERVDILFKL